VRGADIEAEIVLLDSREGGWKASPTNPFRRQFYRGGEDFDAQFEVPGCSHIPLGEAVTALVWFLRPDFQKGQLSPGTTFEIREGQLVRGRGVIKKLLSLEQEQ
jgi:translation elongation factor EF-Tu-like GTPase